MNHGARVVASNLLNRSAKECSAREINYAYSAAKKRLCVLYHI